MIRSVANDPKCRGIFCEDISYTGLILTALSNRNTSLNMFNRCDIKILTEVEFDAHQRTLESIHDSIANMTHKKGFVQDSYKRRRRSSRMHRVKCLVSRLSLKMVIVVVKYTFSS